MSIAADENFAYVIRGGQPIHGTLIPGGNKNAALPMLAATVLADGPVELANLPKIRVCLKSPKSKTGIHQDYYSQKLSCRMAGEL